MSTWFDFIFLRAVAVLLLVIAGYLYFDGARARLWQWESVVERFSVLVLIGMEVYLFITLAGTFALVFPIGMLIAFPIMLNCYDYGYFQKSRFIS